jgi:hypothetical protein
MLTVSVNLNAEVLDRIQTIERKHKHVFDVLLKELGTQINDSEVQCRKAADLRDLYYQMTDNCERAALNIDKLIGEFQRKIITQTDLDAENQKYSELKIYSEEKRQEYEATIQFINAAWKKNLASVTQFFQTMNGVDRDRQTVIMATAAGLGSQFEATIKAVAAQRREVKNAVEKSLGASQKINFTTVQNKVERLARMTLNLSKIAAVEFHYVPFDLVAKEGSWRPKAALLEKSTAGDLTDKDKADLFELVDDLFSSQVVKTKSKMTDTEIASLFSKEGAVVEFLVRAQKILSTEDFLYPMHESKFVLLTKIMRKAIDRFLKRDWGVRKFQGGKIREDHRTVEPNLCGNQWSEGGVGGQIFRGGSVERLRPVGQSIRTASGNGTEE